MRPHLLTDEQWGRVARFIVNERMMSLVQTERVLRMRPDMREAYRIERVPSRITMGRRLREKPIFDFRQGSWDQHHDPTPLQLRRAAWAAYLTSPDYLREKEIEEQRKWLREGKKTLAQINRTLRPRAPSPSPVVGSSPGKTSR